MRSFSLTLAIAMILGAAAVEAHVRISPSESTAGADQRYTMRVPTERNVATTSIELEVPKGVTVASVEPSSGFTFELKRRGDRVVGVIWNGEIKPREFREFVFLARNPKKGTELAWKVHQRYADGTSSDWIDAAGTQQPAPTTKLARAAP